MASTDYNHVLYYNTYSICSIMVRTSFAYRGEARNAQDAVILKEELIEIPKKEQLTEHYLCDVNAYGEVPVIVPLGGKPIPDSVAITQYLAEIYPSLMPPKHAAEIKRLIEKLHTINFFSLTFTGKPESARANIDFLQERLGESISDRYRAAISTKIARIEKQKLGGLKEDEVERNIQRAKTLASELEAVLKESQTDWFFGLSQPSALDAHVLVFIARMQDVKRGELIPDTLKAYADKAMAKDEWRMVMQGRRTMPP